MSWLHANGDRGVWPATLYADRTALPDPFPALRNRRSCDLVVIGAGLTGLSAALRAARAGLSVIVVEAQRVGWGASGRNGGQLGSGFNWSQRKLEVKLGAPTARALWDLAEEAKADARSFMDGASYGPGVISACLKPSDVRSAIAENDWMSRHYGTQGEVLDATAMAQITGSRAYAGGVLDPTAGRCDPLAYTLNLMRACLAEGVEIFERSEVHRLTGTTVATAHGAVTARAVVQATNGYSPWLTDRTAARVLPINNYIAVTAPLADPPFRSGRGQPAVADSRFVVNYFWQTDDGRLIFGGGESYGKRFPADIRAKVRANLARVYPALAQVELTHAWGGTLAVTATRLPYVAEVAPGVFSAGGYSGHGLALAGLFGKLCAEAVLGERSRFDLLRALPVPGLPGGRVFGAWLAQAGMVFGAVRDRMLGARLHAPYDT
ncbi:NAD(P)/FAD-dependent oxidoreductase [Jannaschia donghaensis]|uniref:Gamma-glutamylputrescine oxidoreductase n=1 Tax=Jannaschia donghaensis TaxID=420998 RepID=A0A0M6YDJ3_9RHOB|nr:FAD-binding oxidoreductase [Jannaschia donghaensis]CTQ48422.1 Gamma-glutamylputrescine oxidoreductase [Jannaschia donghaensis]